MRDIGDRLVAVVRPRQRSAGIELMDHEIVVLGMSAAWAGRSRSITP